MTRERSRTPCIFLWLVTLVLAVMPTQLRAHEVQEIVSPRGVTYWLVDVPEIPLVAVRFGFPGGSAQDPPTKDGLTAFLLSMLQEGAGDLDSRAFKQAVQAASVTLNLSGGRDRFTGGMLAASADRMAGAELLRQLLLEPRFAADDIERLRGQLIARLAGSDNDPAERALALWYRTAFAGMAYARPAAGTPESLARITREDLVTHHRRLVTRDGLKVVLVGAIGPRDAGALVDRIFADLPLATHREPILRSSPAVPGPRIVETAEQALSTIVFGLPAMDATHPDFAAASVLNHILGSGDFDARLVEEVRVKRGLTYSIRTALVADTSIAVLLGQLATPHEKSGEAIAVIESELRRMAKDGPSAEEVENAKSVLTGSLLLGIDTSSRLADTLVGLWLDGQGRTALEQRRAAIDSVTITDVRRVGAMLLDPTHMTVVTIGGKAAGRK